MAPKKSYKRRLLQKGQTRKAVLCGRGDSEVCNRTARGRNTSCTHTSNALAVAFINPSTKSAACSTTGLPRMEITDDRMSPYQSDQRVGSRQKSFALPTQYLCPAPPCLELMRAVDKHSE